MDKRYHLNQNELAVISAGFGIEKIYGIYVGKGNVNKKEICMTLHNLYVNALIDNKNSGGFSVDSYLTDLMKNIRNSKYALVIEIGEGTLTDIICCYVGASCCVVSATDKISPNKIILYGEYWDNILNEILKKSINSKIKVSLIESHSGSMTTETVINKETILQDKEKILNLYFEEGKGI